MSRIVPVGIDGNEKGVRGGKWFNISSYEERSVSNERNKLYMDGIHFSLLPKDEQIRFMK